MGDPLGSLPGTPSTRDRLLLVLAELARDGVLTGDALTGDAEKTRTWLASLQSGPEGLESFVFWTRADDEAFDHRGALRADLPLHASSAAVARLVRAVCPSYGISLADSARTDVLLVAAEISAEGRRPHTGGFWGAVRAGRRSVPGRDA
jgi:hypothetical protein